MIPNFADFNQVFMETTKSEHNHGGNGCEFGKCLWSPITNARGAKSYEIMNKPAPGDLVLHNYHYSPDDRSPRSYLCGYSIVDQKAQVRTDEPPSAGDWANRGRYFRIELTGYTELLPRIDFREFTQTYSQALGE